MASEDENLTSSSDSEDSEVNFIADYALEVEGSPNSSDQDGDELNKELEAYADEPLADDDWLAIYEEGRKTEEELEKQLQDRLNGTEEVSKWLVPQCSSRCYKQPPGLLRNPASRFQSSMPEEMKP